MAGAGGLYLSNSDNTALLHDTPLWKAVAYIAEKIGETRDEGEYFPRTRAAIRQKAIDGELMMWGKKQIQSDQPWVETRRFDEILTAIPSEYWGVSKLSATGTYEQEYVNNPYTLPAHPGAWENERNAFADLRVNWKQVAGCWETPETAGSFSDSDTEEGRKAVIEEFIEKMTEAGHKCSKKDIWTAAGYTDATEFERFQRNDSRATKSAAKNFTRVLNMTPEEFIKLLKVKPN